MTKVTFNAQPCGVIAANDHDADVGCAANDSSRPLVMRRESFSDPVIKVVGLTDIERIQRLWRSFLTDDIDARKRLEECAQRMYLKSIGGSANAGKGDRGRDHVLNAGLARSAE